MVAGASTGFSFFVRFINAPVHAANVAIQRRGFLRPLK
jgi:hypothetical protein